MHLVVRIEMPDHMDANYIWEHHEDFFPLGNNRISVDHTILEVDPTDDSFYLFDLVEYDA